MKYKKTSLDGFFNSNIEIESFDKKKNRFSKYQTILGEGNSISKLPYIKKAILIITNFISSLTIFFNHKRELNKYSYLTILSIIIWLIEAIVYYVIAIEFLPNHNKYELIYIILIVCSITNLSGVIPSLPGNIGGFE